MRFLSLERDEGNLKITAIDAHPDVTADSLFKQIPDSQSPIAIGLGPGDFVFSFLPREDGMTDAELENHLRWEIGKKVISEASEYNVDYALIGNRGFAFAGRKKLISGLSSQGRKIFTDVEPAALFNGVEGAGEFENGVMVLVSIEGEGISSVVVEKGIPVGIDSTPFKESVLAKSISNSNPLNFQGMDDLSVERLAEQVIESISRITILGENKKNPSPDIIVLAGGGVYAGNLPNIIETLSGVKVKISSPFKNITGGLDLVQSSFSGKDAAFTTCLGLALRAMEV